jgi:class 3 adenylate cyclase
MTATQALFAGGFAVVAVLAYGWLRARSEVRRLREHAERAAAELQRLQMAFARFAPEAVVERIAAEGVPTDPATRDVTVLFADLVGFTRLGEQLPPDVLVRVLNAYFARMSRVITEHRGHVSKFIGDGLMALFGVPEANPWQANDAVHAALAMRTELQRYNTDLAREGLPSLRVGIGIHRGPVVSGVVGSPELLEYTVIGNTVNVAARIEGLTRVHGVDILISAAVQAAIDRRVLVEALPAVAVAGVSDPVATFAVKGFNT